MTTRKPDWFCCDWNLHRKEVQVLFADFFHCSRGTGAPMRCPFPWHARSWEQVARHFPSPIPAWKVHICQSALPNEHWIILCRTRGQDFSSDNTSLFLSVPCPLELARLDKVFSEQSISVISTTEMWLGQRWLFLTSCRLPWLSSTQCL